MLVYARDRRADRRCGSCGWRRSATMPGARQGLTSLVPDRGDIVDRDGQPLARTIDAWTIAIHPAKIIGDKLDLARQLAAADARTERRAIFRAAAVEASRSSTFAAAPRPDWSRRSMRWASRASPSSASPTGSIRRPALPRTSSAITDIDGHGVAGMERAFDDYLSDPATRGKPLTLSIDSRVQQALEHELSAAMTTFSAIGAAGVVMDVHTGEVLAMTSLPALNPNVAGPGHARRALQPRDAGRLRAWLDVQAVHASRWRWTAASSSRFGQIYNCPQELHVYGHTIHDTHPFGRHLHGRRDHEGKLQHRDGADRRPARRRAAKGVPQENGLPRPGRDRAQGTRPDAHSRVALGSVRDA